jgi:hypothetical protein
VACTSSQQHPCHEYKSTKTAGYDNAPSPARVAANQSWQTGDGIRQGNPGKNTSCLRLFFHMIISTPAFFAT